jgi:hypothetical protein
VRLVLTSDPRRGVAGRQELRNVPTRADAGEERTGERSDKRMPQDRGQADVRKLNVRQGSGDGWTLGERTWTGSNRRNRRSWRNTRVMAKTEDRGQRTEVRGQRTEDRGQRTKERGQRIEDRGQRTEREGREEGEQATAQRAITVRKNQRWRRILIRSIDKYTR